MRLMETLALAVAGKVRLCKNAAVCGGSFRAREDDAWERHARDHQCTDVTMEVTWDKTCAERPCPMCLDDSGGTLVRFLCRACNHRICIACAREWAWRPRARKPYCMRKFLVLCGWPMGRRADCEVYRKVRIVRTYLVACLGSWRAIRAWKAGLGARPGGMDLDGCDGCPLGARSGGGDAGAVCLQLFRRMVLEDDANSGLWEFVRRRGGDGWYQVRDPLAREEDSDEAAAPSSHRGANLDTCVVCRCKSYHTGTRACVVPGQHPASST